MCRFEHATLAPHADAMFASIQQRLRLALAALACATALGGCGGGGGGAGVPAAAPAPAEVATVGAITPASVTPPARVTVTGTHLDGVTQARLGATVLPIVSQAPATLVLDVPVGAATNFITLVTAAITLQSAQPLTVNASMSVTSVAPTSVLTGATLTVSGAGLDRASAVEFAGGASAPVASHSGTTSLTVTVPAAAVSGPIVLVGGGGERLASGVAVTVVPRIVVTNPVSQTASAGASITLNGSGLTEVGAVSVGGVAAAVTARSATTLTFTVPAGVACGEILLQSASQPAVAGGSVISAGGCTLRIEGVEFAQVLSQSESDSYERLVPGKRTMVRAYVVAAASGTAAPHVRLTALSGATALGSLDMTGPATVPVLAAGAAVPAGLQYEEALTFNAVLPSDWVGTGLSVQVTVDPEQRFGPSITRSDMPTVGTRTHIDLVIVPLVSGPFTPTVSASVINDVLSELARSMPAAREDITVTLRAPYTLTSVTDGVETSDEWSAALAELRTLRATEGQGRQYYGMVAPVVAAGIAGIGYVNSPSSNSPLLAALGWDMSRSSWRRTLVHELGHNFSRSHAPCGSVDASDPNYPYAGGAMSATALFNSLVDNVVAPTGTGSDRDVMGYCNGLWFSDYNYREVQRFLERQPQPAALLAAETQATGEVLVIGGSIGADGVRLTPPLLTTGLAQAQASGDYRVVLTLADGRSIDVPFDAPEVDHALTGERHFSVRVPNPGPLVSIEVRRGGHALPRADIAQIYEQRAAAQMRHTKAASAAPASSVQWSEASGRLLVRWDAAAYPVLSVSHLGRERRALALGLRGGQAAIGTVQLPPGGALEFSLSDGLNAVRTVVPR